MEIILEVIIQNLNFKSKATVPLNLLLSQIQWSPVVVNLKGECKLRGFCLLHPEFYYGRTNLTRKPVPRGILNRLL